VLLLGDKRDGGLYTQEEMEIARAGCERLIDTKASAALARRLMILQRQHVAQTQMLDRRARRVLHDDVLPRLHAVLLTFSDAPPEALAQLADAHREISNLLREMPGATTPAVTHLGFVEALRQAAQDDHPGAFDTVKLDIEAQAESLARALPPLVAETLFYAAREAVRNAAKHARRGENAPLQLAITLRARNGLELTVEDDGVGIENAAHSAEEQGGSGRGLALHGAMLAILGGTLELAPRTGGGTRVILRLPGEVVAPL
jgi:signal transduction histidine kinase